MKIKTYDDIIKVDRELASYFLRPDIAVQWIYSVDNGARQLIRKYNKGILEVLRFVSKKEGILGKIGKDNHINLPRQVFARVLLKFCPNAFDAGENKDKLATSMAHYEYVDQLRSIEEEAEEKKPTKPVLAGHVSRQHIMDVEAMLENKPIAENPLSSPSMEDTVERYLRSVIDDTKWPRSIVCVNPQYQKVHPPLSVETYKSETLFENHKPSSIDVYEFVENVLDEDTLYQFIGKYANTRMKLYIVSTKGLLPNVRRIAENDNVGYVRLNPDVEMTREDYILPRSIEDYTEYDILMGKQPMTTPLLIFDGKNLTTSLVDALKEDGIAIKAHYIFNHIPYLSDTEIEQYANGLTRKDVKEKIKYCEKMMSHPTDFTLDPFEHAKSQGVDYDKRKLSNHNQLGLFDIQNKHITLNSDGEHHKERFRFTMAHELGHYILHANWFEKMSILSVGESLSTISSDNNSRRLEIQANKFAAFFLMPKDLVAALYVIIYDIFVRKIYGGDIQPLYYSYSQKETWSNYNKVVGTMSSLLCVSKEAMKNRLVNLKLLIIGN